TANDQFGNIATAYSGHVHFTSSDPSAALAPDAMLIGSQGSVHVTLNTAGSQTITASDTLSTNPAIIGTSPPITTRGLTVTSLTPTATGFTATFSKPLLPGSLALYGADLHTAPDVTLVGAHVGALNGSLVVDPSNMSLTFKATAQSLSLLNGLESV